MKNNQNIVIVLLVASAGILAALLAMTYTGTSQQAQAEPAVGGGDYLMMPVDVRTDRQVLYVLDARSGRVIIYYINEKTDSLDTVTGMRIRDIKALNTR